MTVTGHSTMQTQQASSPHAADGLTSVGWQGCLNEAATEYDVVGVARDFLALLATEEIRELPLECRPGKIVDGDDIASYALTLSRAQYGGGAVVHRMATFFSNAALRLAQIRARTSEVSSEGS
jgi:hypothetical protein